MPSRHFHFSLPAFLVMLVVVGIGIRLGVWQLARADEKRDWLAVQEERGNASIPLPELIAHGDPAHFPVVVRGRFDNEHTILLDNRMHEGVAGYHVLTPLESAGHWVLVNRGWIPRGPDRATLPSIPPVTGEQEVRGRTYIYSSRTFTLGDEPSPASIQWPMRVQKVETRALAAHLGVELAPFEIRVAPDAELEQGPEFVRAWQAGIAGPERHLAYALQWFLLAGAALAVYIAASFRKHA